MRPSLVVQGENHEKPKPKVAESYVSVSGFLVLRKQ